MQERWSSMRIRYRLIGSSDFHDFRSCLRKIFPDVTRCQALADAPRAFKGTIDQFRFGDFERTDSISVIFASSRVRFECGEPDSIRIYLSDRPRLSVSCDGHHRDANAALQVVIAPPRQSAITFGPGYLAVLHLSASAIEEALRLFGESGHLGTLAETLFLSDTTFDFGQLGYQIYDFLGLLERDTEEIVDLLPFRAACHQIFVVRVAHALAHSGRSLRSKGKQRNENVIERVEEYIRQFSGERLSLPDLARYAGLSTRALQSHFVSKHGCSIGQYIKSHRLIRARALLEAEPTKEATVGQIARQAGFTHAGRFTQYYKSMFGEHPSDTLRRSIRRSRVRAPKP